MGIAWLGMLALAVLTACGGSAGTELSAAALEGRRIANSSGCAACHAFDGTGGVGPPYVGLYMSEVTLDDGSKVIADDAYLRRAIVDPEAQIVDGYSLLMPTAILSAADIEAVLTYIRELGPPPGTTTVP